jgi:glucans biosynthesis protein C
VAIFLHFARNRSRVLDSLSRNAYGMYLIHYVFVVWLQYALLNAPLFAVAKAAIVFGVTLVLSWAASAIWGPPGALSPRGLPAMSDCQSIDGAA